MSTGILPLGRTLFGTRENDRSAFGLPVQSPELMYKHVLISSPIDSPHSLIVFGAGFTAYNPRRFREGNLVDAWTTTNFQAPSLSCKGRLSNISKLLMT